MMSDNSALSTEYASLAPLPLPKLDVRVRPATPDDLAFIDDLQKKHSKAVGWMSTGALAGKIEQNERGKGHLLIAEAPRPFDGLRAGERVGYCMGGDQYRKHDDVGIIYQMNVVPGRQRGLIGATLLQAMFDRAAYGCRLFCCWCAQDLAANKFWEAMGFVPIAFRAGSDRKKRVHIFWQKRIREGDATTPWWYPFETEGGSMREERIAWPIPPGTHWSEVKRVEIQAENPPAIADAKPKRLPSPRAKKEPAPPAPSFDSMEMRGLRFMTSDPMGPSTLPMVKAKPARVKKEHPKASPELRAMARELRDRWLEQVNATPMLPGGKYAVSKRIGQATAESIAMERPMLEHRAA